MSYTTLWEVPDGLWSQIKQVLPREKRKGSVGRPALPNRQVVNGILFVLRSGCQWKGLKKEWYGASSSLHKRFQEWNESGLWKKIYRLIVKYYQKKRRIRWKWQAVDSKMVPAPLGGDLTGPNPTDRAKSGSKPHHIFANEIMVLLMQHLLLLSLKNTLPGAGSWSVQSVYRTLKQNNSRRLSVKRELYRRLTKRSLGFSFALLC